MHADLDAEGIAALLTKGLFDTKRKSSSVLLVVSKVYKSGKQFPLLSSEFDHVL